MRGDLQVLEGLRRGTEDDPSYKAHSGNEDPKSYGAPSRLHSAGLALQLLTCSGAEHSRLKGNAGMARMLGIA